MNTCWIDTNACEESFHEFTRNLDGLIQVSHGNGETCDHTEFNFKYFPTIDDVNEMGRIARERMTDDHAAKIPRPPTPPKGDRPS